MSGTLLATDLSLNQQEKLLKHFESSCAQGERRKNTTFELGLVGLSCFQTCICSQERDLIVVTPRTEVNLRRSFINQIHMEIYECFEHFETFLATPHCQLCANVELRFCFTNVRLIEKFNEQRLRQILLMKHTCPGRGILALMFK